MSKQRALIVWGGWNGHHPEIIANIFRNILEESGFEVDSRFDLGAFGDLDYLRSLDLIIPHWTMGTIDNALVQNVSEAVASGVGLAGCHGGMCDAFRGEVLWQFITGGTWVAHPGGDGVEHAIEITAGENPLLEGLSSFKVSTEQYYLHVDPAVTVHAVTRFPNPLARWYHSSNKPADVPMVWTKTWGHGRVFYCALGHDPSLFEIPELREIMRRGFVHAAAGKIHAVENDLSLDAFKSDRQMF